MFFSSKKPGLIASLLMHTNLSVVSELVKDMKEDEGKTRGHSSLTFLFAKVLCGSVFAENKHNIIFITN